MDKQRNLEGLPQEIIDALNEGRAIDDELREIVKQREKLDEAEMRLLEQKAGLNQRAERGNARPGNPGQAGMDTGRTPMPKKKDRSDRSADQANRTATPYQLSLFYYDVQEHYSNFIELYNEIPKYVYDAPRDQKYLESIERNFKVDGKSYTVVLHPARVEVNEGRGKGKKLVTRELFIGTREDLVEDAIIKLAIEKRSLFTVGCDTRAGFFLEEIYDELKRTGHTYSRAEIKEALSVLASARMSIKNEEGAIWELSTYPELMLSSGKKKQRGFVQLHPLASEALRIGKYRQIDYALLMSLKGRYTRRLAKILESKYTWARVGGDSFEVRLRSFLGKHGFKVYDRLADNAKQFRQSLQELKDEYLLESYKEEQIKEGRKTTDYVFTLYAAWKLQKKMKRSEGIVNQIQKKLSEEDT